MSIQNTRIDVQIDCFGVCLRGLLEGWRGMREGRRLIKSRFSRLSSISYLHYSITRSDEIQCGSSMVLLPYCIVHRRNVF